MIKTILIFTVFAFITINAFHQAFNNHVESVEDLYAMKNFVRFTRNFGKTYKSQDETEMRFQIFKSNLKKVEEMNKRSENKVFGVTMFSDLSEDEFKEMYLNKRVEGVEVTEDKVLKPRNTRAVPTVFDWRDQGAVTAVKNQGQCGSCWAFSATENIESVWILAGKATNTTVDLSEQQIVDCDQSDAGCDGGDTITAFEYVMSAGGLESNSDYPYQAQDGSCDFNSKKVVATISDWKYATQNQNEHTMQANLVSWAPLSICVDAASWQFYSGGVMTPSDCGTDLDHCVQVVGYNTAGRQDFWIVRNSWTTSWGVDGYIMLEMWKDTCGVAMEATTAIV